MNHIQASKLEIDEVAKQLRSDLSQGLSSFEAHSRLKKYGTNQLDPKSGEKRGSLVGHLIKRAAFDYLKQFTNPLIELLIICVIVSAVIGEYGNAISVSISVLIVCTISFIQERRADRSLEKLTKQMPSVCKVIREAQAHEVDSHTLVPGDIIHLDEGQRVPADVRLFQLRSLTINEANLSGETQSQVKSECPVNLDDDDDDEAQPADDSKNFIFPNLALMGTIVESGQARGIVICTGRATRYGQVFSLLKSTVQPRSPLQVNIDQLSIHLVVASCLIIALMSILGIVQQRPILEVAYYAISLAVTAIPEGLPVVVAVIMALGVLRLSRQKTIVKSLNSIETLGCIQVLCADKTGTLTRDDMTLTDIVTSELHSLSSSELEELNNEECRKQMTFNKFGGKMYSIGRLMEVGTLCNNASFDPSAGPDNHYIGQATECAILEASLRMGFGDSRSKFERLSEVPFTPSSRKMVVQCQRRDLPNNSPMFYVKGAWEDILAECNNYFEHGLVKPKTDEIWLEYARICTTLGCQGLRVLALASGPAMDQLTFVGVVGINNAPREGMAETVDKLQRDFHVQVKMITGDSRATAVSVARKLGLLDERPEEETRQIMSGLEVQLLLESTMDKLAMAQEISSKALFYRVDPIQKANIVGKLQELDKIVAMTGDGLNDVISLKRANLSIVMGSGADVCKEIADVVIVDNDLSVLSAAVVEGKGIYLKIHSFMSYQISISLALVALVAASFAARIDSPFTVIQLLFINLLADGPPAQSLGVERVPMKELNLRPRNVHEPILNYQLLATIFTLTLALLTVNGTLYFFLLDEFGKLTAHDRSLLFTCFVFCSIFAAISLRSRFKTIFENNILGNRELFFCAIFVLAIQLAFLNLDPLASLFEIEPIPCLELVYLFLLASLVLLAMDTMKIFVRLLDYTHRHMIKMAHSSSSSPSKKSSKLQP